MILSTNILIAQATKEANHRNWIRTSSNNEKLALVIGNSKYQYGNSLSEPANDADAMAAALKAQGYDIVLGYNLNLTEMNIAIDSFSKKLSVYKEAVIYYAGHGFQVGGKNYIAPTSANPGTAWQVGSHCIEVVDFLKAIDRPDIPKLILIDACRNNPFANQWTDSETRDITPGMKAVKVLKNSMVVFSTAENTTVSDYNQFAELMARFIKKGGCINSILGKVNQEIQKLDEYQLVRPTGLLHPEICFDLEYSITDPRDDQRYTYKKMKDGRMWMTQNLNYKTNDSWCFDEASDNHRHYGCLYTWEIAKKVCPVGWHLPSDKEWWTMSSYYGKAFSPSKNNTDAGAGEAAYKSLVNGGSSGFDARIGETYNSNSSFDNLGSYWSSTAYDDVDALLYYFHRSKQSFRRAHGNKNSRRSCRCVKD